MICPLVVMRARKTGHVDDKANNLHAIASLRVLLDATKTQTPATNRREIANDEVFRRYSLHSFIDFIDFIDSFPNCVYGQAGAALPLPDLTPVETIISTEIQAAVAKAQSASQAAAAGSANAAANAANNDGGGGCGGNATGLANNDDAPEVSEPLDLSWPQGTRKRVTYVFLAPLLYVLWLTLPDTRTPRGEWLACDFPPFLLSPFPPFRLYSSLLFLLK